MTSAVIRAIHGAVGTQMSPGSKLLDLSVDLSAVAEQDCPPVALYRIALRDRAWLRELAVRRGDAIGVGALLARFSTESDEPLAGEAATRAVRITIAGIVDPSEWWGTAS